MEEHAPHQQTRRPFWKCHYVRPPPSFIVLLQLINPFRCAVHVMPHLPWPELS